MNGYCCADARNRHHHGEIQSLTYGKVESLSNRRSETLFRDGNRVWARLQRESCEASRVIGS
jgi:hypothetical protein